jgi:predicted NBD/HSP70 family sugar kinase
MSNSFYGVADCGATRTRVAVFDPEGNRLGLISQPTKVREYDRHIQGIADNMGLIVKGKGEIVAGSVAVAGAIDVNGELTQAGDLSPWIKRNLKRDMSDALGMPLSLVGICNDVEAVALSQRDINIKNRQRRRSVVSTISSGFGAALILEDGSILADEPGHQYLRVGAVCPCGEEGHVEAFISGKGVYKNHRQKMERWLEDPINRLKLADDISVSFIKFLDRHKINNSFVPEEFRWTGGVALNQPDIMQSAARSVKSTLKSGAPAFDTVTMGDHAGLHGALVVAEQLARSY